MQSQRKARAIELVLIAEPQPDLCKVTCFISDVQVGTNMWVGYLNVSIGCVREIGQRH